MSNDDTASRRGLGLPAQTPQIDTEVDEMRTELGRLRRRLVDCAICLERLESTRAPDQYRALFEQSADAILIIDGDTFVDCNRATVAMLRYSNKVELLRTHPSELSPPYQPDGRPSFEKANEMIAIAFREGSHRFEWDHVRADGEVFPVEVLLTAVPQGDRQILHVVWRDITERKRLEEQLRHAQKMEAVGKLAGGVAHDFNNLLVSILGHAELIELRLEENDELLPHVVEIRRAGERAAELTRQLLTFSRKQVRRLQVVDLNVVLGDLERLLARLIGEDITLSASVCDTPLPIKADPSQVEQVVINLATNARDAMPAGGTIRIETERIVPPFDDANLPAGLPDGVELALLRVIDNGVGMDEETLRRAFDPFFTTKDVGRGTGLGLATVYGVVQQSGGTVRIESARGVGTTVTLLLPLTAEEPDPRTTPRREASTGDAKGTLLVVEDEPAVSSLIVEVLDNAGYTVHHATNGVAALALVEAGAVQFDLLLTDVVMPLMGGPELAKQLRSRAPDTKVIFMSGYTDDALQSRGSLEPGVDLIAKPFSPQVLLQRLRAALERDSSNEDE